MERLKKSSWLRGICYILIPIIVLIILICIANEKFKNEYGEFKNKTDFAQTEYISREYYLDIISKIKDIEEMKKEEKSTNQYSYQRLQNKYIEIKDNSIEVYYQNSTYSTDSITNGINYIVKDKKDGKIYTNIKITNLDEDIKRIENSEVYWNYKNGNIETNIEKINQKNAKYIYSQYGESYDINQYAEYDIYTNLDIEKISQTATLTLVNQVNDIANIVGKGEYVISIWLIILILIIIYLIWSIGHKDGKEEIEITSIDKIPYEFLVIGFSIFIVVLAEIFLGIIGNIINIPVNMLIGGILGIYIGIYIGLLIIVVSTIRRIKAKQFWKSFFIYKIAKGIRNLIRKFNAKFADKTGTTKKLTILYIIFLAIFIILAQFCNSILGIAIMLAFLWLVYYKMLTYTKKTVEIKNALQEIYEGKNEVYLNPQEYEGILKEMVKYIDDIAGGFNNAIEQTLKSERLKTELITNVSHDIKTPLTSIINYVDLLKKEKFDNKQIEQYIAILDSKSQRLKKLIEDLVEASKVSSGNVKLNLENINLNELLNQTIGEFEDKFKTKGLKIETKMPENPITLKADSRYMYRIIENLFSNISKYAMNNTRVYITLEKNKNNIVLSMKNISNQKLNISADELKQRFVRGDKSRYTEGSGLGLSIAENLTELQGGTFDIQIDGDLFKVTLNWN